MRYSIIIPTLNEEKLIQRLLLLLDNHNLKKKIDYEVIVSDGGSKDRTISIAKKYSDVIIINEDKKQNIAIGRNLGAKKAKGDILIFLNGDILIKDLNLFFEIIENKFVESNYKAMTCKVEISPEESILMDKIFLGFYNFYFHLLNIIGIGMGRGECHIIRKDIFWQMNGYNELFAAGEDFDLFKRIRKTGKILFERNLVIYESPRRYRKIGHFKILLTWLINSFYILVAKKSKSQNWDEIR